MQPLTNDDIEVHLVIEAVRLKYGYDFRGYSEASLKRRLRNFVSEMDVTGIGDLIPLLLRDPNAVSRLVESISVPVSEMFRDPNIQAHIRREVMPVLASFPQIKIWIAGCAGGEEAFSIAIALDELGLLERSQIYATDMNAAIIGKAEEGIIRADDGETMHKNYRESGGTGSLSNYLTVRHGFAKVSDKIREKIFFSTHNLATDGAFFTEFSLIMCRNVMIYFKNSLKERTLRLIWESLSRSGFLCLGPKDVPPSDIVEELLTKIDADLPLYRKIEKIAA